MTENAQGWHVPRMLTKQFVDEAGDWIVCYHPVAERFPLIVAQQGLFTLGSKPNLDHWAITKSLTDNTWYEIRIAKELKPRVMRYVRRMGITHATMFPGISGVAADIHSWIELFHSPLATT